MKVAIAMIASLCALDVLAAPFERTIDAPDGVGDVVALTNALTELNALPQVDRTGARILLKPGIYNLTGVHMKDTHHLYMSDSPGGLFAGLGEGPEETVLVGGGESEAHGVLEAGGGGNWAFNTISNLTITGGWTTSNGGGISGASSIVYRYLIVSNNYATGSTPGTGGGGCFKGRAFNCRFFNNRTRDRWGGGMATGAEDYCNMVATEGQGAWHCVFVDNFAGQYGGGLAINGGGRCVDCSFTNNMASRWGGGVYVHSVNYRSKNGSDSIPLTSQIVDSVFSGNTGAGSGFYSNANLVFVSNCVFIQNKGDTTAFQGDIKNCLFNFNTNSAGVVGNSAMERCVVRNNAVKNRYATAIDYCDNPAVVLTNVNCLIEGNCFVEEYGKILYRKAYVNCTVIGNHMPNGGNYGYLSRDCIFWNSVLFDNRISPSKKFDVRTMTMEGNSIAVAMTNCIFETSDVIADVIGADGTVTHDGLGNCRQLLKAALKLADEPNGDYTPTRRSPLYGTGCEDAWILSLVGSKDLAGNARVFGEGIDIGAYESQINKPGMKFILR